jgi:acetolactate decarboxylase
VSEEAFLDALRVELLRHAELRPDRREHALFQTSTIDALLEGHFDGDVTIAELLSRGDLGLGTLNGCNGELVVLDGRAWQARLDGSLAAVPADAQTPFAVVVPFAADRRLELDGPLDFEALAATLDAADEGEAAGAAVRIEGRFATVRVRSVPRQQPPYPPLAEVIGRQQVTELHGVQGTLLGFRFPGPLDGLEIRGWHLHFATADRASGGHVLDCELEHGTAELDHTNRLRVELPPHVDAPGGASIEHGELLDHLEHDG